MSAIVCEGLGKRYRLHGAGAGGQHDTLRDALAHRVRAFFDRRREPTSDDFWALRDTSLRVEPLRQNRAIGRQTRKEGTLTERCRGAQTPHRIVEHLKGLREAAYDGQREEG